MIEKCVGLSFTKVSEPSINIGTEITLVHDKGNQYSSRAIAVKCGELLLGHIGEKNNVNHEKVFAELPLKGRICTLSRLAKGESFSSFKDGEVTHIEVEFKHSSDGEGKIKSFNEEHDIRFIKDSHRYLYDGKELLSATRYIKKWIKEFDKERISGTCAKAWGVRQEEVLGLWNGGGDVSALFGTVIHNALEHYERFKELGKNIQERKDLEFNKALPSHPVLRKIVEEFYKQDLAEGEVVVEALLTNVDLGLCGFADRILITDRENRTCRVQDYKVNVGSEAEGDKFLGQFASEPPTKMTKYRLQMSFYARLLQLSGWSVQGLDVFIYDGTWIHHDMEVLKLDF